MNIYALPSHQEKTRTHGVDYARIISPMKALNGYKGIKTTLYDILKDEKHNNPAEWFDIMKENDIFYFNYLNNPWGFAAMGMVARKEGVKLVMDVDDDIWDIHKDNPASSVYHRGSPALGNFTSICNEVDYITTTNEYLKHVIMNNTNKTADRIKVFPNYIDLQIYKYVSPFKDDGQIQLLHYGSSTHANDLDDHQFFQGVDRIMREYPNVTLKTISGVFIPKFRERWGQRYSIAFGAQDLYKWVDEKFPRYMSGTDILVVPLVNDVYNKCKSQIKWLEASSTKIPGVWADIRQYQEVVDGTNGLLAEKDKDWYKGIKTLIDDKDKRKRFGEQAYKDVKEKWQLQDHLQEYYDFFESLLTSKE